MKIFNDLVNYEAVKSGDNLIIQLPRGVYDVNGSTLECGYGGRQITVDSSSTVLRKVVFPKELSHWVNLEGDVITKEECENALAQKRQYWNEEDEMFQYPNLEVEYTVKKACEAYENLTPVYNQREPEWEPIKVNVVGAWEETGSDFITTPYQVGRSKFTSEGGLFKLNKSSLATNTLKKWVEREGRSLEISTHSHLEYAKVDGEYVFTRMSEPWVKSYTCCTVYQSIAEAKQAEKDLIRQIESHLDRMFAGKMDEVTKGEVYKGLLALRDSVRELDVKTKSETKRHSLLSSISKLIDKL